MSRTVRLALVVLSLLAASPARSAPAFVQERDTRATSGTTLRLAFSRANVAGNLLVVYVTWRANSAVTVKDSRGNAYATAAGPTAWGSAGTWRAQAFFSRAAAGSNTVTATFDRSNTAAASLYLHEYSGVTTASPLDAAAAAAGSGAAMGSGSLATTVTGDLLLGLGASSGSVTLAGAGFTSRQTHYGAISEDRLAGAAGAYPAAATTQATSSWVMQLLAFRSAGDVEAPTAPTGLVATGASATRMTLAWNASTDNLGVAGYRILRGGASVGTSPTTSYTDGGLQPLATYGYAVTAFDASGNVSAPSDPAVGTTLADTQAPTAPTGLSAVATSTTAASLAWAPSTDDVAVASYQVYRDGAAVGITAATTFAEAGLTPGATYLYAVSASDAAGNLSAASPAPPVTTPLPDVTPPAVPDGLLAQPSAHQVVLTWLPSADDVGTVAYNVFRDSARVASVAGVTSFTDSRLLSGTAYAYAVSALDAAGNESAASPPLSVTTLILPGPSYPLQVSADGRTLVDRLGAPFLVVGDSPQSMVANISLADAQLCLDHRQASGINALWIALLCNGTTGCNYGGSTFDGIAPFTSGTDLATPNEAYFAKVDRILDLAAQRGMVVFLVPADTSGWLPVLRANGLAKARDFGRYLGARYRPLDNIVWMSGVDFQNWGIASDDALVQAVALGIRDLDERHLHTVELNNPRSGSLDDPGWAPIIGLDAAYTYYPTYDQVRVDYNRPNHLPVFLVEANYEGENNTGLELGTPLVLRLQGYRAILAGATGQIYGNKYVWPFLTEWKANLDTVGVAQLAYLKDLFTSRAWQALVPDQQHTFVTSGYGTYQVWGTNLASDYLTAGLTPDGTLGMAYLPGLRTIQVNLTRMSGPVTARWFDPAAGTYQTVPGSPLPRSGITAFAPPGANSAGDGDWVLLLEAPPPVPDVTPPSTPTGLAAQALSPTRIALAWTPATDDVAVAGYQVFRDGVAVASLTPPSWSDGGLSPATTYSYAVIAYDAAGNLSAPSDPLSATTLPPDTTPPSVPGGLRTTAVSSSSATLAWDAAVDDVAVASYQVLRDGAPVGTTVQTTLANSGLLPSSTYAYAVAAIDTSGNASAPSAPLAVTTAAAPSGAAASYALNQGSGTVATDGSGNGNHGTIAGATWTTGKYGGALAFAGTGTVTVPSSTTLNITSSLTLSAWVNVTALSGYQTVLIKETTGICGYWLALAGSELSGGFDNGSGCAEHVTAGLGLKTATWYHLAVVFDDAANTFKLYVNGAVVLSATETGAPRSQTQGLVLGKSSAGERIKGTIDEVRIYNRALSTAEIVADLNTPL